MFQILFWLLLGIVLVGSILGLIVAKLLPPSEPWPHDLFHDNDHTWE